LIGGFRRQIGVGGWPAYWLKIYGFQDRRGVSFFLKLFHCLYSITLISTKSFRIIVLFLPNLTSILYMLISKMTQNGINWMKFIEICILEGRNVEILQKKG
jgi:hypothetical protein